MNSKSNSKMTVIREEDYGVYVWRMPNGQFLSDDEERQLSVPSKIGDRRMIEALKKAAHNYLKDMGLEPEGIACFMAGRRQVSDSEYEHQQMRLRMGLTPDPFDVAVIREDIKHAREHEKRRRN